VPGFGEVDKLRHVRNGSRRIEQWSIDSATNLDVVATERRPDVLRISQRPSLRAVMLNPRRRLIAIRRTSTSTSTGHLHPHALRNNAASLAIASGANVKAGQEMLGHKSATMTLDLDGDLFSDRLDEVGDRLDIGARRRRVPDVYRGTDPRSQLGLETEQTPRHYGRSDVVAPTGFEPALPP
jgi:integrase